MQQRYQGIVLAVSNNVDMPYYLKIFVNAGLVDIYVVEERKEKPQRPNQVKLVFKNEVLKPLLLDWYKLQAFINDKDFPVHELLVTKFNEMRRVAKSKKPTEQDQDLKSLVIKYCKQMRSQLQMTKIRSTDTLIMYNKQFDFESFELRLQQAASATSAVFTIKDIPNILAPFTVLFDELNKAIDDTITIRRTIVDDNSVPASTRTPTTALRIITSRTEINSEKKSANSTAPSPKGFPTTSRSNGADSGLHSEGTPASPKSPLGTYTSELIAFIKLCQNDYIPDNPRIDLEDLTCSISTRACKIPVYSGNKLFDIDALRKMSGYKEGISFNDPDTNEPVYKVSLKPARDIREKTLATIKEEEFFQEFLVNHIEDYANAGFFRRSNFRRQNISNFKELFDFVIDNPNSRSAKIFSAMSKKLNDPFKKFIGLYLQDYQSKFFSRSNFLKGVKDKMIFDMYTALQYAQEPEHVHTRTARLLKPSS